VTCVTTAVVRLLDGCIRKSLLTRNPGTGSIAVTGRDASTEKLAGSRALDTSTSSRPLAGVVNVVARGASPGPSADSDLALWELRGALRTSRQRSLPARTVLSKSIRPGAVPCRRGTAAATVSG
jgi:hypothetical protein